MKVKNSESRIKHHSSHCTEILTFVTQFLWMLTSYALNWSRSKLSTPILVKLWPMRSKPRHHSNRAFPALGRNPWISYQHQRNISSCLLLSLPLQHRRMQFILHDCERPGYFLNLMAVKMK